MSTSRWSPVLGVALLVGSITAQEVTKLDFEHLAASFTQERGLPAAAGRFEDLLDGPGFLKLELGALEVYCPTETLGEKEDAENFEAVVSGFVALQEEWLRWRTEDPAALEAHGKDWKTLSKWIGSWKPTRLAKIEGGSLFDSLDAKDKVREAARAIDLALAADEETTRAVGARVRVVLAPTRLAFAQVAALGGLLDEGSRKVLWNDDITGQTMAWCGWTQLLCLTNASLPVDFEHPYRGRSMNENDKTELAQFAVDRGAASLLRREFWRQEQHFIERSLVGNLVIAVTGKNNLYPGTWQNTVQSSGSSTRPYTRFVPGGNPNGGTLPARKAGPGAVSGSRTEISSWRKEEGVGYFLKALRDGQKAGGAAASKDSDNPQRADRTAHFQLHSFETREDHVASAPFLGPFAEEKTLPPNEFLDDYEDFFRAYRAGFLHWLAEVGPDGMESGPRFARFLSAYATRSQGTALQKLGEEIYGLPLSGQDGSTDSLEWRYLEWLSGKKR